MDTFTEAGGIKPLRQKSLLLSNYLKYLLSDKLTHHVQVISPENESARGCQLSLIIATNHLSGKAVFQNIEAAGITADWREPNVIRVAPVPLYNSFSDVYHFVDILSESLSA